ncbi:hypothetical protein SCHPADRAFT_939944 [Schizopora paradoxa]|uniref:PXA domain-containing protein n=1 Tax=Schizopora paradoxa TaxID=27342 RepID=A0A0H2RQ20_9AGAM|nr:hypothetical protein SCHPADRAFT_939944 [Schizopora paradoxa]
MAASNSSTSLNNTTQPPPVPASTRSISSTTATTTKPAHVALHRRLLFPHLPPSSPVPRLLTHGSPALDAALYELLALALRAHVTPWWSKITRYDREFLPQLSQVICHVLRALETRLLAADLTDLLFRVLPTIVAQHYADYRAAEAKVGSAYAGGGALDTAQVFHQLQPHMAVDAEGRLDPSYVRHTLDCVLGVVLPPEDYESDAEHAIVREVIAKVVLDDVVPLLVQPWFLHKIVLDLLRPGSEKSTETTAPPASSSSKASAGSGPSFHTIVVFVLSTVQYLSGVCLAMIQLYKQTVHTITLVNTSATERREAGAATDTLTEAGVGYASYVLNMASTMMTLEKRSTSRGLLILVEIISRAFSSFSDRLVDYASGKYILTEDTVLVAVKASKETLFPNGYPGPSPVIPTAEEQGVMREKVISQVLERVPGWAAVMVLGPKAETGRGTVEEMLAPLSSPACNAHLLVVVWDVVMVTLFPDLALALPRRPDRSRERTGSGGGSDDSVSL